MGTNESKATAKAGDAATMNPLRALTEFGQSIWLDYIRRSLLTSGDFDRLIDDDGLRGCTSNPAIFEKAITGSSDYAQAISELEKQSGATAMTIYEGLAFADIREAAGRLKRVYDATAAKDGYVSIEVSPYLARNTRETLKEARRTWLAVNRPNVMVKVPGTKEGIPAIRQLLSEGLNINITLLFGIATYEEVAEAYLQGLEERVKKGLDISKIASVASFFVSRIDAAVDSQLAALAKNAKTNKDRQDYEPLMGKTAIANAKLAYQSFKRIFGGARWEALRAKGAMVQRLLWASTSTKDPRFRDVMYVEELIGPDTVNTVPPATMDAFREHGRPGATLESNLDEAKAVMAAIAGAGISLDAVTTKLVDDGVQLFSEAFDKLLAAVDRTCKVFSKDKLNRMTFVLPSEMQSDVQEELENWQVEGKMRRLWSRDASLWTGEDENNWLGWLGIVEDQIENIGHLKGIAAEVKKEGFSDAVVLGMGGSSLCPEVIAETFGKQEGAPSMKVLDSTDPAEIRAVEASIDIRRTLFIVSSKSGTTLEPNILRDYFYDKVTKALGPGKAGAHFVAITDPGSNLQIESEQQGFRRVFFGVPSIGGRYSALSDFGMVPGAVMGMDIDTFLDRAAEMVHACTACVPVAENPGAVLGAILGVGATKYGRDKVTLIASPRIMGLGAWLEQLIAESTGKAGNGLIPVDREPHGKPDDYGKDRLFAYLRLDKSPDGKQESAVDALEKAGHPVVRIGIRDEYDLGQELFRWEVATAVAGSILGVNPFNQPDVEASKIETRKLTDEYERSGMLSPEQPIVEMDGVKLFADPKNAAALAQSVGGDKSVAGYVKAHMDRIGAGDYFGLLAYIARNRTNEAMLQLSRTAVRDKKQVATCLEFGPRFLHSTGQGYKGGPNSGVFLQITCEEQEDLPVPGRKYTFGVVKAAQARGDFEVLAQRGRRVLRIHLGKDVKAGLEWLKQILEESIA